MPLSSAEIAEIASQTARLTQAGLPLGDGLRAAAAELPSRGAAVAMRQLAEAIDAGKTLDQAFDSLGERVPDHLRELLMAGVRTGTLETLLDRYVAAERLSLDLTRELRRTLWYAAFYVTASISLVLFFATYVMGELTTILLDFDAQLPPLTQLLADIAKFGWQTPATMYVGAMLMLWLALAWGGPAVRRAAFRLPLAGPVWHYQALGDFCQLLSLLTERGLPLPAALRLAGRGTPHLAALEGCERAAAEIEAGGDAQSTLQEEPLLAPTLSAGVPWTAGSIALSSGLRIAAVSYWRRARRQLKLVRMVTAPLMLMFVATSIGTVVLGVMLPLIKIIETLT